MLPELKMLKDLNPWLKGILSKLDKECNVLVNKLKGTEVLVKINKKGPTLTNETFFVKQIKLTAGYKPKYIQPIGKEAATMFDRSLII